jgi:hypothetical protein
MVSQKVYYARYLSFLRKQESSYFKPLWKDADSLDNNDQPENPRCLSKGKVTLYEEKRFGRLFGASLSIPITPDVNEKKALSGKRV